MEHKELLIDELGTKKSKKILRQMKNKVIQESNINSVDAIKELMKKKGEELREEQVDENCAKFQQELCRKKEYLPEFNYSAKVVSKIYNLKSIISDNEFAA